MLIFPSGPSIFTVAPGCVRVTRAFGSCAGGGITSNVIFGGNESGALPIFERHWVEVENRDVRGRCANAGTRKAGSVVSRRALGVEFRRALDERIHCRVASMMVLSKGYSIVWICSLNRSCPEQCSKARAMADIKPR